VVTGYVLPPIPYAALLGRRVRRLLPLHVAATLAGAAVLCAPWAIAWRETLFAYGLRPTINGPDWSLRVELLATLLWPLITYAGRGTVALAALMGLSVLGARYWPDLIGLPFFALGINLRAKGAVLSEYRLLMTDRVQLLGRISFSLYLTHWLVLSALGPWGALAVLPVAWAAYHLIEVPSLAWSRGRLTATSLFTSFKSWRTKIGPAALRPAQSRRTP
jgi:peptidoglycan/LPS O-acetylase OafA/YrhL